MKKKDYIKAVIISLPVTFITYLAVIYVINYLLDGVGSVDWRQSILSAIIISVIIIISMKKNADKKIQNKE